MLAKPLCHKYLSDSLSSFNQARMKTLLCSADGLINSNRLTLTDIGRHLNGKGYSKNKIKRIDRFLNNDHLHREQVKLYQSISKPIIADLPYLFIAVDWSGCCGSDYHVLRASLLVDGRALTLYNMVVTEGHKESPESHHTFLTQLATVLGNHPRVYITSDGGFLTPWYRAVRQFGWHFIGRLRGSMKCQLQQQWHSLAQLREDATSTPTALGPAVLTKNSRAGCPAYLHLYHGQTKGRKGRSRFTKDDRMYRNLANEPWLIATSDNRLTSQESIDLYAKRMQIEQNFRDDKSQQYGFSWRFSRTKGVKRISALCLIACVASLVLWLIGFESERRQWQGHFQANTLRTRRVLSFLALAKNVIKQYEKKITKHFIRSCWLHFKQYYLNIFAF